ncbi:polysaccharide pyruvyl transferase family protein [Propioniferax innocua]|uniref:Polysaccharide pyruvyl transferase CsaB n=1 Tax=Propioniferax innocua TaxID=1753 RepID=A0A542ZDG3_9ACTN|nr:polysaccharide pyruvyl transferase family protein [Propioniferax innocua]TQL58300.1 polysaccharide pyruvyl transferase CsaB [Propioniferax innocua]
MNEEIAELRHDLEGKIFDQGFHWRILFLGTSVNGPTDIVASLSRSLRNLGHHVLELDARKHKYRSNPLKRQGGMGPVYVQFESLRPVLDRFEPQMIVCCAGGMTFTEEDAQRLKERGIVLVGITLSDPDVFPSIKEHQHVFDIHTTNAEIALDMYQEAGLNNTVYFPFGIDRGFVTQSVPETGKFDADVICLGHATNRPDRNSMMTALAKDFDVKTYGRGWEIPNSETVSGTEMVQALRGGRIHVNFPLTRAGFVNIKCGVFESAGQGRLVATGRFDEMARFFEYGEEIIGYDDSEDLAHQITHLLANPDELERISVNGFKRIVNDHLYEHRWMDLFRQIRTMDIPNASQLDQKRVADVREILGKSYPRAKKVIVSGFYGARNLGDEAILRSISSRLQSADEAIQVHVASENPTLVEATHGLQAFERKAHRVTGYQVRQASAVVLGGGGLWHDYTFERGGGLSAMFNGGTISIAGFGILPLMGRVIDVPFHVVGMGVGPLDDPLARKAVRYLASQADSIFVRDPESGDMLTEILGSDANIHVGPDTVYAVDLNRISHVIPREVEELKDEGYTIIGLNLRPWAAANMDDVAEAAATALSQVAADLEQRGQKLAVIGLPMQGGKRMDEAAIQSVFKHLPLSVKHVHFAPSGNLSLENYLGALEHCSTILCMRLHAALLAHRSGRPAVGLCYDPKVTRHFAEVGRSDAGLPLTASSEDIARALTASMNSGLSEANTAAVRDLENAALASLDIAVSAIADMEPVEAVYEVPADDEAVANATPAKTAAKPAVAPSAFFTEVQPSSVGLGGVKPKPKGPFRFGTQHLSVGLVGVTQPEAGMYVGHTAKVRFKTPKPLQLALRIKNPYANEMARGKIFLELEIGSFAYRIDLVETAEEIELKYLHRGESTDLRFGLRVVDDAFRARSWETASTAELLIEATTPGHATDKELLIASIGQVTDRYVHPIRQASQP